MKKKSLYYDSKLIFDDNGLNLVDRYDDKVVTREYFEAVSGANGKNRLPNGEYIVDHLRDNRTNPRFVRDDIGFSFDLNDKYDPKLCRNRTLLRIHPDGQAKGLWWKNNGTDGCIGLQGTNCRLKLFKNLVRNYVNLNGSITLIVY